MEPRYVSDLRQEPGLLFRMFTVTNGPKKIGRINGVAVLPGQAQIS